MSYTFPNTLASTKPKFFIHGERDEIFPLKQVRDFYGRCAEPRELVHGAAHALVHEAGDVLGRGGLDSRPGAPGLSRRRIARVVRHHLDGHAARLEGLEGEGVDELLQRHPVLETLGHGDGETGQDPLQGCPLLGQVDEDLPQPSVLIFAGVEIDLVTADDRLLRR